MTRRARFALLTLLVLPGLLRVVGIDVLGAPERAGYDLAARFALTPLQQRPEIVTVVVDDRTLHNLGERWPMERSTWAGFIAELDSLEPAAIAIDVIFDQPAPQRAADLADEVLTTLEGPEFQGHQAADSLREHLEARLTSLDGDRTLGEAFSHAGNIVLGSYERTAMARGGREDRSLRSIPSLRRVARSEGALQIPLDPDGVGRRYDFLLAGPEGRAIPSLALAAALASTEDAEEQRTLSERAQALTEGAPLLRLPTWETMLAVSFEDVKNRAVDAAHAARIKGGIVLVGVDAAAVPDSFRVANSARVPGVGVHTAAVHALLNDSVLHTDRRARLAGLLLLLVFLGLAVAAARRIANARTFAVVLVGLLAAVPVMVVALAETIGWWVGGAPATFAVLGSGGTELVLRYRALGRERRAAEQREAAARESAALKDSLLSMVSHELRTPLTSIRGALGLMSGGAVGEVPGPMQRLVTVARDNTERLLRMVDDILDMARLEARRMSYDFQERSVAEVVSGAVEANLGFGAEHGVQLRFEAPDGDAPVSVDPDRVLQVVANLVSNAVKFSPEGGTVHVSVAPRGDVVRVSIRDEGPGIPEDYREQIFEKFSQAGKSQTGRQRGTGLGLSIARAIVEDHQGTIGFDTETGQGTTFWFELPKVGETAG